MTLMLYLLLSVIAVSMRLNHAGIGAVAVLIQHPKIDQVGIVSDALINGAVAVARKDARNVCAVAVLIRRGSPDKGLLVNNPVSRARVEVGQVHDAAVDDGDSDACADPTLGVHVACRDGAVGNVVEGGADSPVRRDVGHVGIVRECGQSRGGHGVMRAFDEIHFGVESAAERGDTCMMGLCGNRFVLDDDFQVAAAGRRSSGCSSAESFSLPAQATVDVTASPKIASSRSNFFIDVNSLQPSVLASADINDTPVGKPGPVSC